MEQSQKAETSWALLRGNHQAFESFELTKKTLSEDKQDDYSDQKQVFVELDNERFDAVKTRINSFTAQLLDATESTIGCPDTTDGSGLFIQYTEDGITQFWRID